LPVGEAAIPAIADPLPSLTPFDVAAALDGAAGELREIFAKRDGFISLLHFAH
jgi:hypothetical protein